MPLATFVDRRHEYDDVYSFWFRQPRVRFAAGQYAHVQLGAMRERLVQELSFASSPHERDLRFTVHMSSGSRFKRRLDALAPGDRARIAMVRGRLVLPRTAPARPLVLIGGGVGMAPLRSLLLETRQRDWAAPEIIQVQRGAFLYQPELASSAASWHGVRPEAFLDLVKARASSGDAVYYVCGSTRLVSAVRETLRAYGVRRESIRVESFG